MKRSSLMSLEEYERKFERMRDLGKQLGVIVPKTTWHIRVDNPDGSVIQRTQISRSWVRNAYVAQLSNLGACVPNDSSFGDTYLSFKDVAGTIKYGYAYFAYRPIANVYYAVAGEDDWGVVVGTNNTAEDFDDYKLGTQVVHGNGSGQLSHNASEYTVVWTGGSLLMTSTVERIFNNNGGTTISVAEAGLYTKCSLSNSTQEKMMVIRDVISPAIDVVDSAQLTVTYDLQLTYPE